MNFWKRSADYIGKTFLYQIVMSFFGIMMYEATQFNLVLYIIGTLCVLAFYAYILISQSLQKGAKMAEFDHRNKVDSSPFAGFFLSFAAFLPTIVLSAVSCIAPPYYADGSGRNVVPYILNRCFLQGMHLGVLQKLFPTTAEGAAAEVAAANAAAANSQAPYLLLLALPWILLCGLSYLYGYKRFCKGSVNGSFRKEGTEN